MLSSWTTVCVCQFPEPSSKYLLLTRICALAVPEEREGSVTTILEGRGIKYRHRNDDILVPNSIEEQQMKKARKVRDMWYCLLRREVLIVLSKFRKDANAKRMPKRQTRSPNLSGHRKGSTIHARPAPEQSMFSLESQYHTLSLYLIGGHTIADSSSVRLR